MQQNFYIKQNFNSAYETLEHHSHSIFHLNNLLEKEFGNKVIMFFRISDLNGFFYPKSKDFLALPTLSPTVKFLIGEDQQEISMRFFCKTEFTMFTWDKDLFFKSFAAKRKSPILFTIPFDIKEKGEACYSVKCEIELKVTFKNSGVYLTFFCYESQSNYNDYLKIFKKTIKLFQKNPLYNENIKNFPTNNFNLIIKKNIETPIKTVIQETKKGNCYLANLASTIYLKNQNKFYSKKSFIKNWLNIKSRYGVYFNCNDVALASFSPETFLYGNTNCFITEPIKGTLKSQHLTPTQQEAETLWENEKEIFEHTMVVDLMRNDFNQVCTPGSVHVANPFFARKAGSLIQMQSTILGKMKPSENLGSALLKLLPAGSISGTPKHRVKKLILNLENEERGYYTGVCGMLETSGFFDVNVLIRSVYKGKKGIYCGVGAGITSLSSPEAEHKELEIKLESFLSNLEGSL